MLVIILSSLYFMISNKPTYMAWDRNTAAGVRKEYPAWTLVVAALLSLSSLVPIAVGLLTEAFRSGVTPRSVARMGSGSGDKFYRVDTTASCKPMLGDAGDQVT